MYIYFFSYFLNKIEVMKIQFYTLLFKCSIISYLLLSKVILKNNVRDWENRENDKRELWTGRVTCFPMKLSTFGRCKLPGVVVMAQRRRRFG